MKVSKFKGFGAVIKKRHWEQWKLTSETAVEKFGTDALYSSKALDKTEKLAVVRWLTLQDNSIKA